LPPRKVKGMKKLLVVLIALLLCGCGQKQEVEEVEVKKLVMATEATFEPYEFYDGDKIVGIDVEIAEAIAKEIGYEIKIVEADFDTLVSGVQSGKYDISFAGMTVTEERLEKINFTDTYAKGVQAIIVNDGSPITCVDDLYADGANYVVGVQGGTTGEIYSLDDFGEDHVSSYKKTTDAASALLTNKIDCIILDNEPAKAIVEKNPSLKILETKYSEEDYAAAIAKENTELLDLVNNALAKLKADGTIDSIVNKYIGD